MTTPTTSSSDFVNDSKLTNLTAEKPTDEKKDSTAKATENENTISMETSDKITTEDCINPLIHDVPYDNNCPDNFMGKYPENNPVDKKSKKFAENSAQVVEEEVVYSRAERREHRIERDGLAFLLANLRKSTNDSDNNGNNNNNNNGMENIKQYSQNTALSTFGSINRKNQSKRQALAAECNSEALVAKRARFFGNFPPTQPDKIDKNWPETKKVKVEYNFKFDQRNNNNNKKPVFVNRETFARTAVDFGFSKRIPANNYLKGCKWSNNGRFLLTCSQDRKSRQFELVEEDDWASIKLQLYNSVSHGDLIYDYCWLPAGEIYAVTSKDHPIHLWNVTGERISTFRAINHLDELTSAQSICFSPDGRRLFSGFNKKIRCFHCDKPGSDCQTFSTKAENMGGQSSIIACIACHPIQNDTFVAGSYDKTVGMYSERTGGLDCLFTGHSGGLTNLKFSSDGTYLFSAARKDPEIICWDVRFAGQILCSFERKSTTNQRLYFDIDGFDRYLISGSTDGQVFQWDLDRIIKNNNSSTNIDFESKCSTVGPANVLKAARCCINGVSLHPTKAILALTTGQRVYPSPIEEIEDEKNEISTLTDYSNNDNDDNNSSLMYENSNHLSKLDNSVQLWRC